MVRSAQIAGPHEIYLTTLHPNGAWSQHWQQLPLSLRSQVSCAHFLNSRIPGSLDMNTDHIVIPFTPESDVTTPMHLSISDSVLSAPWHYLWQISGKPVNEILEFIVPLKKPSLSLLVELVTVCQVTLNKTLLCLGSSFV